MSGSLADSQAKGRKQGLGHLGKHTISEAQEGIDAAKASQSGTVPPRASSSLQQARSKRSRDWSLAPEVSRKRGVEFKSGGRQRTLRAQILKNFNLA